MTYEDFILSKLDHGANKGFNPVFMPDMLFDFQKHLVDWAVTKGRGSLFEDCGLGKTIQQLVWAQNVVQFCNKPVLILLPLGVLHQAHRESEKFGIETVVSRDGKFPSGAIIVLTNYEKLHLFKATDFAGCVCDESSILKNFDGQTKEAITEFMRQIAFRLLCTATAAPNDYIELRDYVSHKPTTEPLQIKEEAKQKNQDESYFPSYIQLVYRGGNAQSITDSGITAVPLLAFMLVIIPYLCFCGGIEKSQVREELTKTLTSPSNTLSVFVDQADISSPEKLSWGISTRKDSTLSKSLAGRSNFDDLLLVPVNGLISRNEMCNSQSGPFVLSTFINWVSDAVAASEQITFEPAILVPIRKVIFPLQSGLMGGAVYPLPLKTTIALAETVLIGRFSGSFFNSLTAVNPAVIISPATPNITSHSPSFFIRAERLKDETFLNDCLSANNSKKSPTSNTAPETVAQNIGQKYDWAVVLIRVLVLATIIGVPICLIWYAIGCRKGEY